MPPSASPAIEQYEAERDYTHPDLDLDYIDVSARSIADMLRDDDIPEIAYQPGDGTFYGLVIVPLRLLRQVAPRSVDGRVWDAHAVRGMLDNSNPDPALSGMVQINALPHQANGYLVGSVAGSCWPLRLGDRGTLAASYVQEHWRISASSAVSLALLFRAINYYLDQT